MSLFCTSEYPSWFVFVPQQYLYFYQYHLMTLKNLVFILFTPKGGSVFPFIYKPLRQFNLFAHFSCNLIHTDTYILLSMLSELHLLLFHYGNLNVINNMIATAILPAWLSLRLLLQHFQSPLRSDMSKPRLMFSFHFRLFPHYRRHLQAAKHLLPLKALCFPGQNKVGGQGGAGIICSHHKG